MKKYHNNKMIESANGKRDMIVHKNDTKKLSKNKIRIGILIVFIFFFLIPFIEGSQNKINEFDLDISLFGEIVYVVDGDSIVVKHDNQRIQIRLWGIDAPEHKQPHGKEAKMFLRYFVENKNIIFTPKDIDKYGRVVAVVTTKNDIINEEMIRYGHAWVHPYFCNRQPCRKWKVLEEKAKEKRIGLWKNLKSVPPWVWKTKK